MKLIFRCRACAERFESENWEFSGSASVVEDGSGARRLSGTVRVACPKCGRLNSFRPDELACPFGDGA